MADFWGPGLDAELAYRHERLFTALRHTPYGDTHDQRGGEHDDLLAATTHEPGSAHVAATAAAPPALSPSTKATRPKVSASRGWLLPGSETWHAAR